MKLEGEDTESEPHTHQSDVQPLGKLSTAQSGVASQAPSREQTCPFTTDGTPSNCPTVLANSGTELHESLRYPSTLDVTLGGIIKVVPSLY